MKHRPKFYSETPAAIRQRRSRERRRMKMNSALVAAMVTAKRLPECGRDSLVAIDVAAQRLCREWASVVERTGYDPIALVEKMLRERRAKKNGR